MAYGTRYQYHSPTLASVTKIKSARRLYRTPSRGRLADDVLAKDFAIQRMLSRGVNSSKLQVS